MKKNIYILILLATATLTSCQDWFDIDPKTDVKAEAFFETPNGYYSALQGVYTTMAESGTYGKNLTFGFVDRLALIYDNLPSDNTADSKTDIFEYDNETANGYHPKRTLSEIWLSAYNLIANLNNLDKWLDKKGTAVLDDSTFNVMKGELHGLRAFIHFDLLRLWGPMGYDESDTKTYIPYRTVADNSKQPLLTQKVIVEKILADLAVAEHRLTADRGISLVDNNRRFRFNYYAAKALEARVYNYCGMKQKAIAAAAEVIDNCGLRLQSDNIDDPTFFAETLFGIYMYKMSDNLSGEFSEGSEKETLETKYHTNVNTLQNYFENFTGTSSDVDIRVKSSGFFSFQSSLYISRKYIKNDVEVIPLIRLPEMYYIMCESSDLANAPDYVNAVKSKRGYTKSSLVQTFVDEATRQHVLNYEYRTEFYAEGQYFHFMKRNGIQKLNYAPDVTYAADKYIFPLPDEEKEYGWTDGTEETND